VSGRVARRQQRKYADQHAAYTQTQAAAMGQGLDEGYYPPPQAAAPAEADYMAELEQLAQLKAQGILTEEEFQAKKKQILGI
jgi:hypothetical protein